MTGSLKSNKPMDYKSAGVDIEAGRAFVERIRKSVEKTHRNEVIGGIGGFGGIIRLPAGMRQPLMIAGTDGVGTKLTLAQEQEAHQGVGIDLVAMCVNDVITSGAEPLFFLDYIATGSMSPAAMTEVVEGISQGCLKCGCALLGGETAEMPGFYSKGCYDLAGFCVAVVEEFNLIDGQKIKPGDRIIGVNSSGLHSNGFSLVRQVIDHAGADSNTRYGINQRSLIDDLLIPTTLYSELVKCLIKDDIEIHGMSHITGGGLTENIPRPLPPGTRAKIFQGSWPIPELFKWLQEKGEISEREMWNTFNIGIGYCIFLPAEQESNCLLLCKKQGLKAWTIGEVLASENSRFPKIEGVPD